MKEVESKTYVLKKIGYCSYAIITLTDLHENCGTLSIISDYGNWSYLWGSMGSDIKSFLIDTNSQYLMDKLTMTNRSDRDCFDFGKTIILMKRKIIEYRKDDFIDSDLARRAYDQAKDLEKTENNFYSQHEYYREAMEYEAIAEVFNGDYFPCHLSYSGAIVSFFDEVWPEFIKRIKQ